jgi:hypothetical protein
MKDDAKEHHGNEEGKNSCEIAEKVVRISFDCKTDKDAGSESGASPYSNLKVGS